MAVFNEKQDELEHYELRMGVPRGRLAVTMDLVTDAMALVGQHGVYCQSQRWPGKPVMDVQLIMKNLTDAKATDSECDGRTPAQNVNWKKPKFFAGHFPGAYLAQKDLQSSIWSARFSGPVLPCLD